jgi:hypothetical protein
MHRVEALRTVIVTTLLFRVNLHHVNVSQETVLALSLRQHPQVAVLAGLLQIFLRERFNKLWFCERLLRILDLLDFLSLVQILLLQALFLG